MSRLAEPASSRARITRASLVVLGTLFVSLAVIGVFLPLVPTFDFLLLASLCYAKSSPRLDAWLLNHPRFGPGLRAWRASRSISPGGKLALSALLVASSIALFLTGLAMAVKVGFALGALTLCWYVLLRKSAAPDELREAKPL